MARDAPLWYTALLAPVALAVASVSLIPQDTVMVLLLSPVFLGIQASRTIAAEDGAPLRLSVSAGCAALDDAEPTAEALLRTADVALSMAKRGGRDRVVAA